MYILLNKKLFKKNLIILFFEYLFFLIEIKEKKENIFIHYKLSNNARK